MIKIIICAPSGAGKTSVIEGIIKIFPNIVFSKSFTTRPKRDGEVDGIEYFFTNRETFEEMETNNKFIEAEEVYGNKYGTPTHYLESDFPVIFNLDSRGYESIKKLDKTAIGILILPPSLIELKSRLLKRKEENIEQRFQAAIHEIRDCKNFEYIVINDVLSDAIEKVKNIIEIEIEKKKSLDLMKNEFQV